MNTLRFEGKVAIVTGAGTGIGRATALALAKEGAHVVVANRNVDNGQGTVAAIRAAGGSALFLQTDVSKEADVQNLVGAVHERFGKLDLLINNAGILGDLTPAADSTEENFDRVVGTNLKGPWLCMKHAIPHMAKQKRGVIINVTSATAIRTFPYLAIYSATKAGLMALTRVAAVEYASQGIHIKSVCVGGVRTPMSESTMSTPEGAAGLAAMHPVNRVAEPEEIANAILWLCSSEASFSIGPTLNVTGGMEIA
jgi:NAD(P)-dependent dehydrogenase (short-subunit alcohol dehydrogenase family)